MNWRITDPAHLLGAMRTSLQQGGEFLTSRIAPNGPILRERNLSYIHKASWGMYAAGVDHGTIARLLDWAQAEALRGNGDFYFPEEAPEYKDYQRVYRPLNFLKVAAWIGHPLARDRRVLDRILQYQHASGGVFHYIGDDPQRPEEQPMIGTLDTTFFGHLMIALDTRDRAVAVGEWVRRWVDANREHMAHGLLYTKMTPGGELVTQAAPGERISRIVDTQSPKQEFWNVGTAMAYLAVLYDAMRSRWEETEERARPYLEAALALLDFESTMPLDTYLWPSKCKVGWGAGELLRVLVRYHAEDQQSHGRPDRGEGWPGSSANEPPGVRPSGGSPRSTPATRRPEDGGTIEQAYRVAERVAVFTFMDNQLPHGGWSWMHYPLNEQIPEMAFSYKPLKNTVSVPSQRIEGSQTIFLPPEEITGEFLGELKAIEQGVAARLDAAG